MKLKTFSILAPIVACALWTACYDNGLQASDSAFKYDDQSFINGQNIGLSNNTTILYPGTNVLFVDFSGNINYQGNNTNAAGVQNPFPLADCNIYPNGNGDAISNVTIAVTMNYTNILPGPNQNFTNGAATNAFGLGPKATNTVTITFYRSVDGFYFDNSGAAANQFVLVITNSLVNTNGFTFITNLPTSFTTGARKIRVASILTDNLGSGTGMLLNRLRLGSWHP